MIMSFTDENYQLKMEDYLNNSVKISSGKKKAWPLKVVFSLFFL